MSASEVTMSVTDDQLTVMLPDAPLVNGLGSSSQPPDIGDVSSSCVTSAGIQTTYSPSSTSVLVTAPCTPTTTTTVSSRFKVQPTCTAQPIAYNHSQYTNDNSASAVVTVSTISHVDGRREAVGPEAMANLSHSRKRVSFPDGQALIKGFAHAPNPWYNVSLCTTENLVSAYIHSCNVHGVRPLPKLVSQLNKIQDFGERINKLTLKGEHLNNKHIESLEEIFRRVQFVNVDMEGTHLDDESAIALFEMAEYYESVVHLKLCHNKNLGIRAWAAASRMIRKTQHLESIDLRGCSLNEQCVASLGRALRMGAYVQVLYLQECALSSRAIMILSAALRMIPTIKELYIGENNLQPADGIQIGNLLRNNTYLHTLDVRFNNLQNIGIARICDGLAAQPHGIGLKSLNISHNHFNAAITSGIAAALAQTKSLNTLDISYNTISNEGFFVLKEGLLKNKSLCRLSLRATRLSDEGAVALAEYIADSYTVSQLDLRDNDIKTAGLLAVSMCLRVHQTITRLDIDQNVKKEHAVKDYQSQQRFFLDEIQSQVALNADVQRAKLDRLLIQSRSERAGTATSEVLTSLTSSAEGSTTNTTTEAAVTGAGSSAIPEPSEPAPQATGVYFDPLGAVSVGADAEKGTIIVDTTVSTTTGLTSTVLCHGNTMATQSSDPFPSGDETVEDNSLSVSEEIRSIDPGLQSEDDRFVSAEKHGHEIDNNCDVFDVEDLANDVASDETGEKFNSSSVNVPDGEASASVDTLSDIPLSPAIVSAQSNFTLDPLVCSAGDTGTSYSVPTLKELARLSSPTSDSKVEIDFEMVNNSDVEGNGTTDCQVEETVDSSSVTQTEAINGFNKPAMPETSNSKTNVTRTSADISNITDASLVDCSQSTVNSLGLPSNIDSYNSAHNTSLVPADDLPHSVDGAEQVLKDSGEVVDDSTDQSVIDDSEEVIDDSGEVVDNSTGRQVIDDSGEVVDDSTGIKVIDDNGEVVDDSTDIGLLDNVTRESEDDNIRCDSSITGDIASLSSLATAALPKSTVQAENVLENNDNLDEP